jgi:hypothetical protein
LNTERMEMLKQYHEKHLEAIKIFQEEFLKMSCIPGWIREELDSSLRSSIRRLKEDVEKKTKSMEPGVQLTDLKGVKFDMNVWKQVASEFIQEDQMIIEATEKLREVIKSHPRDCKDAQGNWIK